jgi:hypothetical protein
LNRRHMVLQVMSPAIRGIAPQRGRDDTWLPATANGSTNGWRAGTFVHRYMWAVRFER